METYRGKGSVRLRDLFECALGVNVCVKLVRFFCEMWSVEKRLRLLLFYMGELVARPAFPDA
jgi:hypothetical protein